MFEAILVICPKPFHQAITAILQQAHSALNIQCIETKVDLMLLSADLFQHARLISFLNDVIIPDFILKKISYGAYNFHPGSPSYPGHAPYSFALYENEKTHSVTLHEMLAKVDAGRIVAVDSFPIPNACTQSTLVKLSIDAAAAMLSRLAPQLVCSEALDVSEISWGTQKNTKALFAKRCEIPDYISKQELEKRIQAFGGGDGLSKLYLIKNGKKYMYQAIALENQLSDVVEIHEAKFVSADRR
jgi:methionyl-tRNA formyltransferase